MICIGLMWGSVVQPSRAAEAIAEDSVKAAFLYQFLSYIEWPAAARAREAEAITIGVLGADFIAAELQNLASGRLVKGHPVRVKVLASADALEGLHLLFVGRDAKAALTRLAPRAQQLGIPIVTESPDALEQGSTLNFVVVDGRVRFVASLSAARRAGITLSSRLLGVALAVQAESP